MSWLQIRFFTTPNHQETLEDALLEAGAASITYQDAKDQPILEPALNETPLWDQLILTALFTADINVQATLALVEIFFGGPLPDSTVEILEDKDWVREWMDAYQPMSFGERLWICPSWCEPPQPDAVNIMLDPGLAFGTGTHPTTAMCLRVLDNLPVDDQQVIDYGCGSGILAIAALLLGAKHATCVDNDPQALIATTDNAERNHIATNAIHSYLPDAEPQTPVDLVMANILAGPLVELAPKLTALIKVGGQLVLSGVLDSQRQSIIDAYPTVEFTAFNTEQEWLCLVGIRKSDA